MAVARENRRFRVLDDDPVAPIRDAIDAVTRPTHEASGMPNEVYVDERFFAVERDRVMAGTWACIGFASDLPQNGYAKPVRFMGLPLVMIRNREGEINVFHNVCSHRGMELVQEETAVQGALRCPYHSWTYDLDGNLKGTPHIGGVGEHKVEGFDCTNHGLRSIRSAEWMDMIFINLSGDAPGFDEHIAPLEARWREFIGDDGFHLMRRVNMGGSLDIEVDCNWKLAVENYCEAYHLPWVHPSLNSYSRLEDHYTITLDGPFAGQGSRAYNLADVAGTRLPEFPAWPADRRRHAEYIAFFPNVLLGIQIDHAFALMLEPVSQGRTVEHLRAYYVGDEAARDEYASARRATLESWRVVFSEDIAAVEGMQLGRSSPAFSGGVFSPVMDIPTHHFHRWVAGRMAGPSHEGDEVSR
ncbi:aromatic ring-hydroxylating dioxygenase subunit alpha [Arhodomonas aquaeolei]|uniref:aromatic ring-hydroxylating oxygenase subunit alpha n=1 Tax=Arhodomonas aquaeolei TaxID=2369 RepID=UPI002169A324|nr:aromatic ring-hydroxylating dioxygenase subunit alpha [Arhodomonas aquaeolei]MCS4505988.1 aromatic ring-hydroxylating dioxygenase subunit alpha [Arhodomonas aquaeolei]